MAGRSTKSGKQRGARLPVAAGDEVADLLDAGDLVNCHCHIVITMLCGGCVEMLLALWMVVPLRFSMLRSACS